MNNQEIGKHITLLRKERGLTQEKLAEVLSVSPQAVSKWENGHSLPETLLLPGLARSSWWIISGSKAWPALTKI